MPIAGRVLLEQNRDQQAAAFALDQESCVEIDRQRHQLTGKRRFGDGRVQGNWMNRQLEAERSEQVAGPVAGAQHDAAGVNDLGAGDTPPGT